MKFIDIAVKSVGTIVFAFVLVGTALLSSIVDAPLPMFPTRARTSLICCRRRTVLFFCYGQYHTLVALSCLYLNFGFMGSNCFSSWAPVIKNRSVQSMGRGRRSQTEPLRVRESARKASVFFFLTSVSVFFSTSILVLQNDMSPPVDCAGVPGSLILSLRPSFLFVFNFPTMLRSTMRWTCETYPCISWLSVLMSTSFS